MSTPSTSADPSVHEAIQEVGDDLEPEDLTPAELDDLVEAEKSAPAIRYSSQDFDVNGLVRRINSEDVLVPIFGHDDPRITSAGFQRGFVWNKPQMDRFIESLLLGYPIPGVFLVRQADRRYLVLDGQQRLRTLQAFYSGIHEGKEFSLANVAEQFEGLTYKSLNEEQRRMLDDTFITATIVAVDSGPKSLNSIYQVFERLNSGGTQLTPHEIRVALYAGRFIDYLENLNRDENWRELYGKRSARLRDQELLLRILALYVNSASYRRPLKTFLNGFVEAHRDMQDLAAELVESRFRITAQLIAESVGRDALRRGPQVNAALTEAVFVGLMRRLDQGTVPAVGAVEGALLSLRDNQEFQRVIGRATADEENVRLRLEQATASFART